MSAGNSFASEDYKINLPPEPDSILNATTLYGIDSNQNGVRDDIEIYIYKNVTQDWNLYNAYMQYYRNKQDTLIFLNNEQKFDYFTGEGDWKAFSCISYFEKNIKMSASQFLNIFFNTKARKEAQKAIGQKMKGFSRKIKDREERLADCNFKVKK